jgi:hypothetical protein
VIAVPAGRALYSGILLCAARGRWRSNAAGGKASKNFNADQQQMHADARGWDWGACIGRLVRSDPAASGKDGQAGPRPIRVHRCASAADLR